MAINKTENELSLQIALGEMDQRDGMLTEEGAEDLADLEIIQVSKFFTGTDEYLHLHGIDGALSRFRVSRTGQYFNDLRHQLYSGELLTAVKRVKKIINDFDFLAKEELIKKIA
ncbi:MAG: hypothetical protein Q7R49_00995 [Candidatus Daviesbacteria bacterium]|nr:hypothetical protein [Candidatus Daviesbacteria bacterium]